MQKVYELFKNEKTKKKTVETKTLIQKQIKKY